MQFKNNLITGGVNPVYNCSAIQNNIIVYGCSNQLFIYDIFNKNQVIQTLKGHKKRVNTIQFLQTNNQQTTIVSGSSDGEIILWTNKSNNITDFGYEIIKKQKLTGSISFITSHTINKNIYILVGDCQGLVQFLQFQEQDSSLNLIDVITFPTTSVIEVGDFHLFDFQQSKKIVLALGSLDHSIHIYTLNQQSEQGKLEYRLSLKGHNNAITAVTFQHFINPESNSNYILLASASKYSYIRLHKIQLKKDIQNIQSYDKKTSFSLDQDNQISLESVLYGHQDTVVSLKWGLHNKNGSLNNENDIALLSASFDFSVILWAHEEGIWISKAKLGEVSGNKHAFFNAQFDSSYQNIIAYTYTGAFNVWERESCDTFKFSSKNAISGHISYVTDLDWSSDSNQLVSCSQDQTTRIYAENTNTSIWNEYSRAQIHGYDINSIKFLKLESPSEDRKYCDLLICGADEKVLRLLEPPAHYLNYLNSQNKANLRLYIPSEQDEKQVIDLQQTEKKGCLQYLTQTEGGQQVLGLMTKSVQIKEKVNTYYDHEEGQQQQKKDDIFDEKVILSKQNYSVPPSEDFLEKHTLWPELNKFYGHGYEISTISSNHSGSVIVSACKSQTQDQSVILFYDPNTYSITDKLLFHNYTVLQLEFSHNDEYLASISRDRQFALFKRNSETQKYEPFFSDQSHTRIIWSLNFSGDDKYIITSGRDKRVKLWALQEDNKTVQKIHEKLFKQPVTACCFSKFPIKQKGQDEEYWLTALGFENGLVEFYKFFHSKKDKECFQYIDKLPQPLAHSNIIKRLKFRPYHNTNNTNQFQLASCSSDHSLRLTTITLN